MAPLGTPACAAVARRCAATPAPKSIASQLTLTLLPSPPLTNCRPIPISALPPTDLLEGLSAQDSLAIQSARSLLALY